MFRSVPGVFGNQQANYLNLIKQMLQQAVVDMTNYEVIHIIYIIFIYSLTGDRYSNFDN